MFINKLFNELKGNLTKKSRIEITTLDLPLKIHYLDKDESIELLDKLFDVYKSIMSIPKEPEEFEKKEWSTWEISIILRYYKYNFDLRVDKKEDLFPAFVCDLNDVQLEEKIQQILLNYNKKDKKGFSEERLRKDVFWTLKEISYLFYHLSMYKRFK